MEKDMSEAQDSPSTNQMSKLNFVEITTIKVDQGRMYKMLEKIYHPHHPEFAWEEGGESVAQVLTG